MHLQSQIPRQMLAISIQNPGPNSQLLLENHPVPNIKQHEILVKVAACALNHADLFQSAGRYPPPAGVTDTPGLELAGIVVAIGKQVSQFQIGDAVYGLVAGGAYAQYCVVDESLAHKFPKHWSFAMAAAIPEALTTAHATVFELANLKSQESFLVHGAGSGIASMAIQMAHLIGAEVISTLGHEDKIEKAKALGANELINYRTNNFLKVLGTERIDVILDYIGHDYLAQHLELLKTKGRLIQIACLKGSQTTLALSPLIQKRLTIQGFMLRPQTLEEKAHLWAAAHARWGHALQSNALLPIVDSTFAIKDAALAHKRMQQSLHFGKIILEMNEDDFAGCDA